MCNNVRVLHQWQIQKFFLVGAHIRRNFLKLITFYNKKFNIRIKLSVIGHIWGGKKNLSEDTFKKKTFEWGQLQNFKKKIEV